MPKPRESLYKHAKKGRLAIRPELLPDVAAMLIIHLNRCEDAARKQSRMMRELADGTLTTSPSYYRHAAGYLRHLLTVLQASVPADQLDTARQLYLEAEQRAAEPKPTPGGEG